MTTVVQSFSQAAKKLQGWHLGNRELTARLARGAFWGVVGVVLEKLITLAVVVATVRILQREQYGMLSILQSTTATLSIFAICGMGTTATRFMAKHKFSEYETAREIVSLLYYTAFFICLLVFTTVIFGAEAIAADIISEPQLSHLLILLASAIVFITLDGIQQGVLLGHEEIKKIGAINFSSVLFAAPVQVLLTWQYGLNGAVYGLIFVAFLRWLLSAISMFKNTSIHLPYRYASLFKKHIGVLRNYALPSMMSGLMITPVHWICHGMLMRSSDGASEMAVVGVVNQWFYIILFLPAAAGKALLPILSDMVGRSDINNSKNILLLNTVCNSIVVVPVVVAIACFGNWIMGQYGADFIGQEPVLLLYSAAAAMAAVCLPLGYFLAANGGMWIAFSINAIWALIYIFCSGYVIDLGAKGLAIGIATAYAIHLLSTSFCVWLSIKKAG